MGSSDKRGEIVALVGGLTSLLAGVILIILAVWSESTAVWAASFQALGAVGVWLLTLIQLHQQRLVTEERLEVADLQRQRHEKLAGAQTIFKEEELDQMDALAMGRRLRTIERYLVPTLAIIVALYHVAAGAAILPWRWQLPAIKAASHVVNNKATVLLFFMIGIAFACFMLSRYALGMSRIAQWNLLRAGGNFLFGTSALCLAVAVALLCNISGIEWVETWLGWAIGILLFVLAVETLINFVLDFYRPRVPDQVQRPFYDSRLFGMFSEPEGILRSVANAIDYQFGFRVSETWFYKLLGRAVLPLLLVQVAVIAALTCIVVVPPGHQAVIEHYGRRPQSTAKPGIHFTWFWPIDRTTIIPVERVQRMAIGYEEAAVKHEEEIGVPILWTKRHYKKEYQLLVADRKASASAKGVPVNLLSINMPVQWRVKDEDAEVIRYHAQAADVPAIIESLAFRELTRYAAEADVLDLLGKGGIEASRELYERIQKACDQAGYDGGGLGVKIVHVGIGGVHPPPDEEVAKAYEDVVSAFETKEARIKESLGEAAKMRVESAGTEWKELYDAIVAEDQAKSGSKERAERTAAVERILREVIGGQARGRTAQAVFRAYQRVFDQKSAAESYITQVAAYRLAPNIYLYRKYLKLMEDGLRNIRKYIVVLDDSAAVTYEMDLRPPGGLNVLSEEILAGEKKAEAAR